LVLDSFAKKQLINQSKKKKKQHKQQQQQQKTTKKDEKNNKTRNPHIIQDTHVEKTMVEGYGHLDPGIDQTYL
jgi:ABC-type Zn uptake system ZnuABC Zn-binding protein ZnuA